MKKLTYLISLLVLASLLLAACGGAPEPTAAPTQAPTEVVVATEPPTATEPPLPAFEAPEGALVSYPADVAPVLDGIADDAAWADAQETVISVSGGYNDFAVDASLKSVYSGDTVYFVLTYADPTESWFRSPWQKQEDGSWK